MPGLLLEDAACLRYALSPVLSSSLMESSHEPFPRRPAHLRPARALPIYGRRGPCPNSCLFLASHRCAWPGDGLPPDDRQTWMLDSNTYQTQPTPALPCSPEGWFCSCLVVLLARCLSPVISPISPLLFVLP